MPLPLLYLDVNIQIGSSSPLYSLHILNIMHRATLKCCPGLLQDRRLTDQFGAPCSRQTINTHLSCRTSMQNCFRGCYFDQSYTRYHSSLFFMQFFCLPAFNY